ncbi:MAG TPA: glycoside hydrolase family 3 N-terminal domain-containing protein [Candidatus Angelobacter sp.]|jgi:beta-N-acetylhexosaminidase|nr:glycoside hydrolase family 3 N-terminal domain-containing protein [Candidatus Angelobacter sp.]
MSKKLFLFVVPLLLCGWGVSEDFQHPGPVKLDREGEHWAQRTLKKLSLEEKIGQLFMVRVQAQFLDLRSPDYLRLKEQLDKYHLGSVLVTVPAEGPFLYKTEPYEMAMLVNQLQRQSRLPLIVAADFERGLSMRLNGATIFPHAMAFGAAGKRELAEQFGKIVAREARAVGVEWNFFPVADVNSNPANPIINTRAFGEDPQQVSALEVAYIQGARQEGMLTTAKHFPGHGDTDTDSHLGLAAVNRTRDQIEQIDLQPFRSAIAAGVDSIMIAHVTAPALEPDANKVATTSTAIINGILKQELGFKGLVVTDALEMGALTRLYPQAGSAASAQAAVDAFKAGNDILLLPSDLKGAYQGLLDAVHSGTITESQINESVLKILRAKASVGLHKARLVDINRVAERVAQPESLLVAQQVAASSLTLVRENGKLLPFQSAMARPNGRHDAPSIKDGTSTSSHAYEKSGEQETPLLCVILTDDVRTENGRQLERELRRREPNVRILYLDPRFASAMAAEVQDSVRSARRILVAVYIVPTAGKAMQTPATILSKILEIARQKTVVVAFGSPYIAADFPEIENYLCAYSNVPTSESAVVQALYGQTAIQGHLPVTIPGIAQRGEGIQRSPELP